MRSWLLGNGWISTRAGHWWWIERWRVKAQMAIAWRVPRWLAYWCTIRVGAHATQGQYSNQIVPDLRLTDALQRWAR